MSKLVPENMREIRLALLDAQDEGKKVNEDDLIAQAVQNIFQAYIDDAEEGHYDTCKLVHDRKFMIIDTNSKVTKTFQLTDSTFVEAFKQDSQKLLLQLAKWSQQIL